MKANSAYTETYLERHIREKGFVNGIYTPWFNGIYGRDIGTGILDNYSRCDFDKNRVGQVLYNCRAIGFDMAKIWLNENLEGMLFDDTGRVTGVEPLFMQNLEIICQMAQDLGLQLGFCVVAHAECVRDKRRYDKYMRFVQVAEETEQYIENWLKPVLSLADRYPSVVTLIDVYAEPEADACLWNLSRGIKWETMKRFINRLADAVKEYNPLLATTVSSYNPIWLEKGHYGEMHTDYVGADVYNEEGKFPHTLDMVLDRPFMLGEYGLENRLANDEQQIDAIQKFQENFKRSRVQAAFFWHYGWLRKKDADKPVKDEAHDGELGLTASYYHYLQLDRAYTRTGYTGYDVPQMLYVESPAKIRWFGSRGAVSYVLERQDVTGNWHEVIQMDAKPQYPQYPELLRFADDNMDAVAYRAVSVMPDGTHLVSEAAYVEKQEGNAQ